MKIAIITLPIHTNYGGILQAYALKTVLEGYGNEVFVLDPEEKIHLPEWWKAPVVYPKRLLLNILKGGSGPEVFRELRLRKESPLISVKTAGFISEYISPVSIKSYDSILEDYDAFVVGSDQVWRPRYFGKIENAFLDFTSGWDVKRVAYAASFGTDQLEYDFQQLDNCSALLKRFDGISVREKSAVAMCDEWFDCDRAVQVLDPVMLLPTEAYQSLAQRGNGRAIRTYAMSYFLDTPKNMKSLKDFLFRAARMEVLDASVPSDRRIPVEKRVLPPVGKWLADIIDSSFVITDSFHVCVLSILFHKPFLVVANPARGVSRIESLLATFSLESRMVQGIDPSDDGEGWLMEIDWDRVDCILEQKRKESFDFIEKYLKSGSE
ncbi:MAG: polysaccharide pyruvyl transferase family protein [Candidatus Cryptobacteroides sp.]